MLKTFVILVSLLLPVVSLASECTDESSLMVTAPRDGARTFNSMITFRGFACEEAHMILVQNLTTKEEFLTETDEVCDAEHCIYRFATFVYNLAAGANELQATIPGENPESSKTIAVIRSALVWNDGFEPMDVMNGY